MLSKIVSRSIAFATIIAVALASISVTGVFAAGLRTSSQRIADQNLTSQWKQELATLQMEKFRNNDIVKWFREWMESTPSSTDRSKESKFAISADRSLLQAEAIAAKHAGFAANGTVTDRAQAVETIRNLELYLHDFHMDLINKLENLFF